MWHCHIVVVLGGGWVVKQLLKEVVVVETRWRLVDEVVVKKARVVCSQCACEFPVNAAYAVQYQTDWLLT